MSAASRMSNALGSASSFDGILIFCRSILQILRLVGKANISLVYSLLVQIGGKAQRHAHSSPLNLLITMA